MAEEWVSTHSDAFDQQERVTFAMELRPNGPLIGAIGLNLHLRHEWAELGYWVGKPYWNQGYCTEAAHELLRYGFEVLRIKRHAMMSAVFCCPVCKGSLSSTSTAFHCGPFARSFQVVDGIPDFFISESGHDFSSDPNIIWLDPEVVEARDTIYRLCTRELEDNYD